MEVDKYGEILEKAGVKPTSIRILVYKAIENMEDTFSLGDLEDELTSVDKSSLFRTLTILNQHNLIHSVDDGSGSLKYCVCHNHGECTEEEEHCHFYCEICKKTYCLEEDLIPYIKLPEGFAAHSVNYIVKGICSNCSKKKH